MDSSIQSFKQQIEEMFEKSFQNLNKKNQLNKNILSNLLEAANQQSNQIYELDSKLSQLNEHFQANNDKELYSNRNLITKNQEEQINDQFGLMIHRLQQIEQGINHQKRNMQVNLKDNAQSEQKMDKMIYQLEQIIKKQNVPQYKGDREMLMQQIQEFESLLKLKIEKQKGVNENMEFYKKTVLEPLNTFETKIALHNKANEQILKDKLINFTEKIKKLEKKVQETTLMMNSEINKSNQEQRKIIEEMNLLQNEMTKLRCDLESADDKRKQTMQSHALSLDNMVEQMLSEAKKLEIRVESLKKGYEDQNQKLRNQISNQKMTM